MKVQPLHRGMTLVELLVVLAIIGILVALLLPAVQRVRDAGYRVHCESHLQQIGLALHQYHDTYGSLPPGMSYRDRTDPFLCMGWCTRLLPFVEQQALWQTTLQAYAENSAFMVDPPAAVRVPQRSIAISRTRRKWSRVSWRKRCTRPSRHARCSEGRPMGNVLFVRGWRRA